MKRKPKRKPTKPAPTDFVGEPPEWETVIQNGPNCIATTTAAVPCKDPLKRKTNGIKPNEIRLFHFSR